MISIRTAEAEDVDQLVAFLRPVDRLEVVLASGGMPVRDAVHKAREVSHYCLAGRVDGRCHGVWGLTALSPLWGSYEPWALFTPWPETHPRQFLRASKYLVREMKEQADYLSNHVLVQNEMSSSWLPRLGFTMHSPVVRYGHLWYPFHWEK